MILLSMHDLADRWDKSYNLIRLWKFRGKIPDPDVKAGQSPFWYEDTIKELEQSNGIGRTTSPG